MAAASGFRGLKSPIVQRVFGDNVKTRLVGEDVVKLR